MKIKFSKKNIYSIVGFLIVLSFFWFGYKSSQKYEAGQNNQGEQEGQSDITSEKASEYPFNLIEGKVLNISEGKIEIMADLSKIYPQEEFLTKKIEIIVTDQTNLIKMNINSNTSMPATIQDFEPSDTSGPIVVKIQEENQNILSESVFTATEMIVFVAE